MPWSMMPIPSASSSVAKITIARLSALLEMCRQAYPHQLAVLGPEVSP